MQKKYVYVSKSPSKKPKLKAGQIEAAKYDAIKQKLGQIPKKIYSNETIVDLKNKQDSKNYYAYIDSDLLLNKKSTYEEIQLYLTQFLELSTTRELTNTQKFMLDKYITLYTQGLFEKGLLSAKTKNMKQELTASDLRKQWGILCKCWKIYAARQDICRMGEDNTQEKELREKFIKLAQQIQKVAKTKQKSDKLEQIRKMMKKFYQLMLE